MKRSRKRSAPLPGCGPNWVPGASRATRPKWAARVSDVGASADSADLHLRYRVAPTMRARNQVISLPESHHVAELGHPPRVTGHSSPFPYRPGVMWTGWVDLDALHRVSKKHRKAA